MRLNIKPTLFFLSILLFTFLSTITILGMINFTQSNMYLVVFWSLGFFLFTLNIGYMLVCSFVSFFFQDNLLEERNDLSILPNTALIYVVRNEDEMLLMDNLKHSFENNYKKNVDLWLLSNSDSEEIIKQEQKIIANLKQIFGPERVRYFQTRDNLLRRKHICIQEWLHTYLQYSYILVCDADSTLPAGSVEKLIHKGEHPDNANIVVFQSQINVVRGNTYFACFLGNGQDFCQRIYSRSNQIIFGRGVSYGSGCLIRCKEFRKIDVPYWVLSHDIWDTIFLEEKNYKVVFCPDVITYGSFPNNYIDYIKRSERWIKGTMESLGIILKKKIPEGTRFMAFYPIYMYLSQPIFLLWIASGIFYGSRMGHPLLVTQRYAFLGGNLIDFEMSSHLFITLGIIKLHRFTKCKNLKECGLVFVDLFTSLLLCLNNLIMDSMAVIRWLFLRKRGIKWIPTPKKLQKDIGIIPVTKKLWPSTLVGIIGLTFGCIYSPAWAVVASPFLISFIFGIPLTYMTARELKKPY